VTIDAVLGPGGLLAAALPGYEHRPEQLAMGRAVALALEDHRALLVEAGTGTGKTLAYLAPAVLSGKRVVVSTGTKHLQEQIFGKDLPLLAEALGRDIDAVVLKGIANYVCRRKLAEIGMTSDPELVAITSWAQRSERGDKGELGTVPDDAPAWGRVTTTPEARVGPSCSYFERCFVTQARRAAARAQLVIVNHHLFFADLALRTTHPGAGVLPSYDAVIFDEAHQLEDVVTEHFGIGVSSLRLGQLVRDARRALTQVAAGKSQADARVAALMLTTLEQRGERFFDLVGRRLGELGPDSARQSLPDDLFVDAGRQEAWFELDASLEEIGAPAERRASDRSATDDAHDEREAALAVARRARLVRDHLAEVADAGRPGRLVRWGERRGKSVFLHASPIEVGGLVADNLLRDVEAAIFASATLTADGRFDYVRERLGLTPEWADELAVDSPFDYPRQALLYLPRDLPLPGQPGFEAAAQARIIELCAITGGRAFVLFTSHRSLAAAARALRPQLPYPVLVQGEAPRASLLESFRRTPGSVLLATASFWEGVDVPGEALSLVILEKLPFAAPDDPLVAARARKLEEAGQDPFMTYQAPRAAIVLKQGFGRLIRRKDDRGIVALLDHRILSKAYGRLFLGSLPAATRTSALEQVRRWWHAAPG
jgi:ATP-dependent DNA helicase DinG